MNDQRKGAYLAISNAWKQDKAKEWNQYVPRPTLENFLQGASDNLRNLILNSNHVTDADREFLKRRGREFVEAGHESKRHICEKEAVKIAAINCRSADDLD